MKGIFKTIIVIVLLVILAFVAYSSGLLDTFTATGQTYESNGITFQYPDSWTEANCVSDGAIGAVVDSNNSNISVVIQQVPPEYGSDIQNACAVNDQFLSQSSNYVNIQEINSSIHNQSVVMHRYLVNEPDGSQKEHVATWIKMRDNKIYVILFSTPVNSYEQERSSYDLVAGTFNLTNNSNNTSLFPINL